jgi:hypothetical protein
MLKDLTIDIYPVNVSEVSRIFSNYIQLEKQSFTTLDLSPSNGVKLLKIISNEPPSLSIYDHII